MKIPKGTQQDVNTLLHRAVDIDQVTFTQIEALKLRFSHDIGLSLTLDSILDGVIANADVLQELHTRMIPYPPTSIDGLSSSGSPLLFASARNDHFHP